LRQEFNDRIPAGLPPGTRVAHKTGEITAVAHDAAIVYPAGRRSPYVLVVLTRGIKEPGASASLIADISRLVYQYVIGRSGAAQSSGE
jgi:beta-lactamase class A